MQRLCRYNLQGGKNSFVFVFITLHKNHYTRNIFAKVFFSKDQNGRVKQWLLMIIGLKIIIYSKSHITLPSLK